MYFNPLFDAIPEECKPATQCLSWDNPEAFSESQQMIGAYEVAATFAYVLEFLNARNAIESDATMMEFMCRPDFENAYFNFFKKTKDMSIAHEIQVSFLRIIKPLLEPQF